MGDEIVRLLNVSSEYRRTLWLTALLAGLRDDDRRTVSIQSKALPAMEARGSGLL
jgi:hypothetical protein